MLKILFSIRQFRLKNEAFLFHILEDFVNASPYFCTFLGNRIYGIENLLADFNVQPRIGMNQS